MIDRYTSSTMKTWWSDTFKFQQYLRVELASLEALFQRKFIDEPTWLKLKKAAFTLEGIAQHEAVLRHDVLAFVESCRDSLGEEKRWFHFGLTSSDVIDSAHGLLFHTINIHLTELLNQLAHVLKEKAYAYQHTPIMARTHGMFAEPTVYGLRYALWFDDLQRLMKQFQMAREGIEVLKLSGSIGTYPILPVEHEQRVARILGLSTSAIHTQVLQRDRHATYMFSMVNLAGLIEKIALDIRLLSRSEIMEVSEAFGSKQKGSSAMPHKRNPIQCENLMGLARLMRGYLSAVNENQALWHERDISHSSVERVAFMDATTLLETMLTNITRVIQGLEVRPERMAEHVRLTYDTHWSQVILHRAILQGLDRDEVYRVLQQTAFKAMDSKTSMVTLLQQDGQFPPSLLKDLTTSLPEVVSAIYQRVFK